jgi:hypothetical protein
MIHRLRRLILSLCAAGLSLAALALVTPGSAAGVAAPFIGANCTSVNWGAETCTECEEKCDDPFGCDFYCSPEYYPDFGHVCTCQNPE